MQDTRTRSRWWLLAILVLALAVRVTSFRGFQTYDAAEYARLAWMMVSGQFRLGMEWFFPVFPVRVGLFGPAALAFSIGGVNELTLVAYPFLLSMLGVAVAFLAGRAMFGDRAGLVAAGLMALLPIDAWFASRLMPDLPAAFWMNAGVLLVFAGSRQEAVGRKMLLGLLAGAALVASWLCKETVLYLLPFVGVYLVWLAARDRRNLALLAGTGAAAVLLLGLEGWMYRRATGDWLFHLHALRRNFEGAGGAVPSVTLGHVAEFVARRGGGVARDILLSAQFALVPAVALVACAYAALRRSRRFLVPGLWFGWLLLMYGFGSTSLSAYAPLKLHMSRFHYPLLLPAVLLVAGLVAALFGRRGTDEPAARARVRRLLGMLLCVWLAGVSLAMLGWGIGSGMGRRRGVERAMARVLGPTDPVYTDGHTAIGLQFFWQRLATDSIHEFEGMSAGEIPAGVFVLLNRDELDRLARVSKYLLPGFRDSVPGTWLPVFDRDNATLYRVPAGPD